MRQTSVQYQPGSPVPPGVAKRDASWHRLIRNGNGNVQLLRKVSNIRIQTIRPVPNVNLEAVGHPTCRESKGRERSDAGERQDGLLGSHGGQGYQTIFQIPKCPAVCSDHWALFGSNPRSQWRRVVNVDHSEPVLA